MKTSANMCPAIEFSIHDPDSIYSGYGISITVVIKRQGRLGTCAVFTEHPLVNEAIRQVEQLQKQQEKHQDVAR